MMLEILRDYGWTYQEYMSQPDFVLELARKKKKVDNINELNARKQAEKKRP